MSVYDTLIRANFDSYIISNRISKLDQSDESLTNRNTLIT